VITATAFKLTFLKTRRRNTGEGKTPNARLCYMTSNLWRCARDGGEFARSLVVWNGDSVAEM